MTEPFLRIVIILGIAFLAVLGMHVLGDGHGRWSRARVTGLVLCFVPGFLFAFYSMWLGAGAVMGWFR